MLLGRLGTYRLLLEYLLNEILMKMNENSLKLHIYLYKYSKHIWNRFCGRAHHALPLKDEMIMSYVYNNNNKNITVVDAKKYKIIYFNLL